MRKEVSVLMVLKTFKATANRKNGLAVEAVTRNFKVNVDEPKELGGTNTGMNPVELLLNSLGACQTIAMTTFAKKFGVHLEHIRVELEGDLDTDGFLGKADVRPGFQDIRLKLYLKTDTAEDKVNKLIDYVQSHCPVADSIGHGVKIEPPKITVEK